ncbi:MAG TPA: outer membrane protein assembly factor BamC [Casimicrobiaceae bacterium]|nr:outer membrane protein assembly factor BamC [Casimicrobiaceae bacterium]
MNVRSKLRAPRCALILVVLVSLAGCESMNISSLGKRIDYKSASRTPSLELPPDLTTPQYDERYSIATASGVAAREATRPKQADLLPTNSQAHIVRAGTQRWLVVKATPEQAWSTVRKFWTDTGFVIATEQPVVGVMETDWAENRAEIPQDILRKYIGKYIDVFYTTYKRDKFRTRIERGAEPGTVEIYVSHRGMEQVPTTKIDNATPAGFAWALMPANPGLEAEMLSRLMMRFGAPEAVAEAAISATAVANAPVHARLEKSDGVAKLIVDDPFDRAWRRVGLALDRTGFTVVDRDRSSGTYFVRYADPDADMLRKDREKGFLSKLMNVFKKDDENKPEQYRIKVAQDTTPQSTVSVQDPSGNPDKTQASERILALLRDQLK